MTKPAIAWNHHENVWQAVLPEGTVVRHKSLSVLESFLDYLDLRQQQAAANRPTQKQADRRANAITAVAVTTVLCIVTAVAAWLW